jgi:hypothetical protein
MGISLCENTNRKDTRSFALTLRNSSIIDGSGGL